MSEPQRHYRTCNLCEAMCGIEVTHQNGTILTIKGDKNDPFSRGHICPKATALKDIHEDPDRLKQPLERTADGWRTLSWDEALDKAANGIKAVQSQYGNNALATYLGNPNVHNTGAMLMGKHLHNALRTRNRFSATSVDQLPHHIVAYHLFGHQLKIPVPDIDHTDFFLIIGANPVASNGSIMTVPDVKKRLTAISRRGGKTVVIDPRRTETAALADQHHFIRPGTDALLMLAMIHTLFEHNRVNPGRLQAFTPGLTELQGYVKAYRPERVAAKTGISAEAIRTLVDDFCRAEKAVCYGRMGVSVQAFGLLTQYLIMVFNMLTGRLDSRGGMMFTRPAADVLAQTGRGHLGKGHTRVRGLPEFGGEYPVSALAEEMLTPGEGQIRSLVTAAGNPVLSTPNGQALDKALAQLDFMVAIDFYLNETTRHAHIILPPVSPLEREHYDVIFHTLAVRNTAKYAPALFDPPAEAMQDWEIYMALEARLRPATSWHEKLTRVVEKRLGPGGLLSLLLMQGPYGSWSPFNKRRLRLNTLKANPSGIDLGPLQPALPQSLYHRDKTIHLHVDFYMADLKRVEATFFSDEQEAEGFLLIGRRHIRSNNSWLHNSHRLVKGKARCTAQIHPDDARRLGLSPEDKLKLRSRSGSLVIDPEITEAIMPGVISIPHGWGHNREGLRLRVAEKHAGVSVNDITDAQAIDALSGNAVLNGVPVELDVVPQPVAHSLQDLETTYDH